MVFGFQHLASQPGDNCCSWILPQASGLQVRCLEGLPEEEAATEESLQPLGLAGTLDIVLLLWLGARGPAWGNCWL